MMSGANTPQGMPEPREGIQLQVLKKSDGAWLIETLQNTLTIPERPFPTSQLYPESPMVLKTIGSWLRHPC